MVIESAKHFRGLLPECVRHQGNTFGNGCEHDDAGGVFDAVE